MLLKMKVARLTGAVVLSMALSWGSARAQETTARAHGMPGGEVGVGSSELQAPAPWLQEDPGSRAYAAAREALNAGSYRRAAGAFRDLRRDFPESGYVADSYYYQAFSLSRIGGGSDLREARELLTTQMERYPSAATLADAEELMIRVESRLARQGDARAAVAITRQASDPCGPGQEVRAAALNALLNMDAEKALPILKEVLQDKDACSAELREQAVFLVAQKLDEESVDILLDLAHRNPDPDPGVREQAVFWLSQVRSEEAMQALESILTQSNDPEVQESAIFAIAQHRSERSMEILQSYAEREDLPVETRENAIFWIGQNQGGAEYLLSLWDRIRNPELKENILFAVAQTRGQESREWLVQRAMDRQEDLEVRKNALFWAGQQGAFTLPELRELFSNFSDAELKEQVIFVASQRREPEAVDFLMEVAENEENGKLREDAIFWLGQSKDPRVPEFLLRIIGR